MSDRAPLRLKLDENLPRSAATLLRAAGHDVDDVHAEGLAGRPDPDVFAACRREGRVLLTLDTDFADVRAYPPAAGPGVVVLRPRDQQVDAVLALLSRVVPLWAEEPPAGALWIVTEQRVRVRR